MRWDGEAFIGSVSAGCVESEVIEAAKACMKNGKTRWLSFGPENGFPWEVALSFGGKIVYSVEPFAGQTDDDDDDDDAGVCDGDGDDGDDDDDGDDGDADGDGC